MDNQQLRSIIIKLESRLSDDDRERLHFFLGNDVPRRIRDDGSLRGTLRLMDSLFDQDKINQQDFTFLIYAFEQIQCMDAVNLLREHKREMLSQSIQSLASIMPMAIQKLIEDLETDKYSIQKSLSNSLSDNDNVEMTPLKDTKVNPAAKHVHDHSLKSTHKQSLITLKCCFGCVLLILSISGSAWLTSFIIYRTHHFQNNQIKQKLLDHIQKLNETIRDLNNIRAENERQIQTLTNQLNENLSSAYQRTCHRYQFKANLKWKQYATTIAGGNGVGNQLNQLYWPHGIYIDSKQKAMYIADFHNHRIVKWEFGASNGTVVAGGNGGGHGIDQLLKPVDVIVDQKNKSLIICDNGNKRVVRWSMENPLDREIIISYIGCYGLVMNDHGDLFVSDWGKHEVKRWRRGEKEEAVVAGGHGKGDQLNQLNNPTFIFIDHNDTIYVSEFSNHRVMKWVKDAKEGIVVAGGQGHGESFNQSSEPHGLIVNEVGDIYVADYFNHRIMCWSSGSKEGRLVVGGNGEGQESNQLNRPTGLSFDGENNLYVVDRRNNRIQRFDVDLD